MSDIGDILDTRHVLATTAAPVRLSGAWLQALPRLAPPLCTVQGGCLHGHCQDVGGILHCGKEVPIVDEIIQGNSVGFLREKWSVLFLYDFI